MVKFQTFNIDFIHKTGQAGIVSHGVTSIGHLYPLCGIVHGYLKSNLVHPEGQRIEFVSAHVVAW